MATKKQQQRKKKAREQKAKARVEARRHKLGLARRDERRSAALERRFRERQQPIVNDPEKKAAIVEAEKNKVLERLRRNAEILKALEDQYQRDMDTKKAINDSLEAEGFVDIKDKFKALESKAREAVNPQSGEDSENSSKVD